MGCINSKTEFKEQPSNLNRLSNVYRVYACRIFSDSGTTQNGYLELSPKELIFLPEVGDTVKWALQHLRRYGCTGEVFSFEAGRRCMTGPGIYTFRCNNAENMHQLFQSYINTVARNEESVSMVCSESIDLITSNSNEVYLEPTLPTSSTLYNRSNNSRRDSNQGSPVSSNLNSPNSFHGVNYTNEVIHLNPQTNKHVYPNSNVYQEFPLKPNEFNNNIKKRSDDMPPQELAPNIHNLELKTLHSRKHVGISDKQHMYENVEGLHKSASSERCYENFSSIDLPILLSEQMKTSTVDISTVVNYITLDLVQSPTSTDSFSLKAKANNETLETHNNLIKDNNDDIPNCIKAHECQGNNAFQARILTDLSCNTTNAFSSNQSSSMGYSTIDFIKTCALIKSVPSYDIDCQESRITRHSTCIMKNSSLSD